MHILSEYRELFEDINYILDRQDKFLSKGLIPIDKRIEALKSLKNAIKYYERDTFGGGCINDTISHVASKSLPFGGVGTSGMGRYHGQSSFDCFTYEKAIVKKSTKIELKLVFPPYKNRLALVRRFFMK